MDNLFNSETGILRQFLAVNVNNTWDTIEAYIDDAQQMILPLVGDEMWAKLQLDLILESVDPDHLALLKLVRKAQANFAYLLYTSDGAVQISDAGILQVEESGTKSAYQWQVREFKKARSERGWAAMEQILNLLLTKRDIYTQWSESSTYNEVLACWIPLLRTFNKHRRIHGFETLWALRPSMIFIQEKIIMQNLGEDLYLEISGEFLDDDLSPENTILFNTYILPVIAHLGMERASMELNFSSTAQGLRVDSVESGSDNNSKNVPADRVDAYNVRKDAEEKGEAALKELRKYLNKNASATKFPSYFLDADLYSSDEEDSTFENNGGGTYWTA